MGWLDGKDDKMWGNPKNSSRHGITRVKPKTKDGKKVGVNTSNMGRRRKKGHKE
jgi:hypothetical protein